MRRSPARSGNSTLPTHRRDFFPRYRELVVAADTDAVPLLVVPARLVADVAFGATVGRVVVGVVRFIASSTHDGRLGASATPISEKRVSRMMREASPSNGVS